MITRKTMAVLTLAIYLFTLNACKKSVDKNANCRIVTITEVTGGNTNIYNLTYNNDGKISTLTGSGSSNINKVFTYGGNTILINVTNSGITTLDSITLNGQGRPTNIRQYLNAAGTQWYNYSFEYNGNDLLKYVETDHGGTSNTVTFSSSGGNTTQAVQGATTINFEYFTDKAVQKGDYIELSGLIQFGVNIYPHKNLVKSISFVPGSIANFNYDFNPDGLVEKITLTSGANTSTIGYQYACN